MAVQGYIDFYFAAAMVLGANVGTTVDAALAAIGTKTVAKRAALVHVLFNILGCVWAVPAISLLIGMVDYIMPDTTNIAVRIALFHTVFNVANTLIFLPFVTPFGRLVEFLIKDKTPKTLADEKISLGVYKLPYISGSIQDSPELNVVRAQKEITDMAALVFGMYRTLRKTTLNITQETVEPMLEELNAKEAYADQMRDELSVFLMECTRRQLSLRSEHNVSQLLRIVADLESMTDDCVSISYIYEKAVRKNRVFSHDEIEALTPYMGQVEEFLMFVGDHLGTKLTQEQSNYAHSIEKDIDDARNRLRKLGQSHIEEGGNVRRELLFIDLVRRIEHLGDYCNSISTALAKME
jgi:phosphate:Na+ symporter